MFSAAAVIEMVTRTGSDFREAPQTHNPNIKSEETQDYGINDITVSIP